MMSGARSRKIDFIDSTIPISNIIPTKIFKDIFSSYLMAIENYAAVAKLNKYLNSVTTSKIFTILETEFNREVLNENLKDQEMETVRQLTNAENRKKRQYDNNIGCFKKSAIESRFKETTKMPLDFMSTLSYAHGKRAYAATVSFDKDSINRLTNFLFRKHSDLDKYVTRYSLFGRQLAEIMIREHELSFLNDSSIIKDNPVPINSPHIQEVVSKRTACLLGNKMSEVPFVQFINSYGILKMVLRFKDANNAREVMYALQKESYDFPNCSVRYQDNLFNKFDTYPCEYIDQTTNESHRFIASSSITLTGELNVCNYIFDTCQSDKQPVKDFLAIHSKLGFEIKGVIYGLMSAFNKFIDNKITEFQNKQKNTGLSYLFQNNHAISVKLEFLKKIKKQLADCYCYSDPYNRLDQVFKSTDISKIDKNTLANYQRFKDIFYEIHHYLPGLNNQSAAKTKKAN